MIGTTVGKYRILARLGRGGMGTVYRAIDETLDREVAIKVLNSDVGDARLMARFRAEATTLARLNHPEIATIYEIHKTDTDLMMVMELVRGETLDELSVRVGPLPPERAAYLVAQVLNGLGYAHRAGIVHRDLKPANIMVTDAGTVKIMDFGIARVLGAEHLTSDGTMMGTPAYMAPEQVLGKDVDARADLYSAGVVFYRLLTGCLPFQADTPIGIVQKQLWEPPTPVRSYRSDLPDWCEVVLTRALMKTPAERFQSADEFRSALLSSIGHSTRGIHSSAVFTVPVPPPPPQTPQMPTPSPASTPIGGLTPAEFAAAPTVTMLRTPTPFPMSGGATPPDPGPAMSASSDVVNRTVQAYPSGANFDAAGQLEPVVAPALADAAPVSIPAQPVQAVAAPASVAVSTVALSQVAAVAKRTQQVASGSRRRLYMVAGAAGAAVLAIGVGVFTLAGRRTVSPPTPASDVATRQAVSEPVSAPAAAEAESALASVEPIAAALPADAGAAPPPPSATSAVPVATNGAANPAAAAPKAAAARTRSEAPAPATPVPEPPPPAPEIASTPPPAPVPETTEASTASAAAALSPVTFSAQTIVVEDGKNRQRDTNVELANGVVTVTDRDNKLVTSLPYTAVLGFTYSNSRQPMWNTPQGPAEIAHLDGGAFGFFRGDQHWVSLRTDGMSLVLRVREQDRARVIAALEERIGKKVERVRNR